jgi:hypothetical protein
MSSVRRPRVASITVELVAACSLVLSGCSGADDSSPQPTAAPSEATDSGTPLEDVDTTSLVVPRAPFCDRVDPAAVTRALGEEAADVSAYRSGQRVRISDDVADVVHEFGCRWTAGDQTAEAWVFAPPVTRKRAQVLLREEPGRPCQDYESAPAFGDPYSWCLRRVPGDTEAMRFQGLFGDAWLTCSLTLAGVSGRDLTDRATRWCAAVATGAATD